MTKDDEDKPTIEEIVAEKVITVRQVAELLGVDYKTHYFRVVHEVTRDAAPWVLVRMQALKR
jgi:hypothetical protein